MGRGGKSLLAAAALSLLLAASASGDPLTDPAAPIYDPHTVETVNLTLSAEAIAHLEAEPNEYVKGSFEMASTSGGPGGTETPLTPAPLPVEVRLKGSGSFRPITGKAALKLKFKKSEPFLGLKKMTLNNMVQDRSMVHEALSYLAFGAVAVPASRSGYAFVRVNGEAFGLYADVETLDKVALEKRFGSFEAPPQHLYEGELGIDVLPGEASKFEVDEGEEDERVDLENLIEAVNGSGPETWSERVAPYADLEEMTRMWAVEHYIYHWDGYAGHAEQWLRPNNYYLFSEASGRFQMLPWGTDQTWNLHPGNPSLADEFDTKGGVMFNLCLEDEACRLLYWEALGEVVDAVEAMDPGGFLEAAAETLLPWEELEREEGRPEFDANEVGAAVKETAEFIENRPEEARAWLAANEPPAKEPPVEEPAKEEPAKEEKHAAEEEQPKKVEEKTQTRPQETTPARPPRLGRVLRHGRELTVEVYSPRPANVRAVATLVHGGRTVSACRVSVKFTTAGRRVLSCSLSETAVETLAERALSLKLHVFINADDGETRTLGRPVRLARTGEN